MKRFFVERWAALLLAAGAVASCDVSALGGDSPEISFEKADYKIPYSGRFTIRCRYTPGYRLEWESGNAEIKLYSSEKEEGWMAYTFSHKAENDFVLKAVLRGKLGFRKAEAKAEMSLQHADLKWKSRRPDGLFLETDQYFNFEFVESALVVETDPPMAEVKWQVIPVEGEAPEYMQTIDMLVLKPGVHKEDTIRYDVRATVNSGTAFEKTLEAHYYTAHTPYQMWTIAEWEFDRGYTSAREAWRDTLNMKVGEEAMLYVFSNPEGYVSPYWHSNTPEEYFSPSGGEYRIEPVPQAVKLLFTPLRKGIYDVSFIGRVVKIE